MIHIVILIVILIKPAGFVGFLIYIMFLLVSSLWMFVRDLSEISRGEGVGILNLGSEMRWHIPARLPAMGVKFANTPLDLGLKYHDPPPLV